MYPMTDNQTATPPLVSIFILSAAALAYEVLLIRLFSIIHWHHFAFMVISLALLGYGVSGSLITVFRRWLLDNYDSVFIANTLLFGITSILCYIAVQQLPFNALEILWDSSQWQRLLLSYLLLTLPFFFVANAIALTMMRFHQKIALVYGIDLIGAGIGAVSIMALLQIFSPDVVLRILGISGIAAGLFAMGLFTSGLSAPGNLSKRQKQITASVLLMCMFAIAMTPQKWLDLRMSEYKGLAQTLLIKDASLRFQHTSPVSQTDVVQSPLIPFRHAPGMSLQSPKGPPEQLAVFRDGDEMTTIDHVTDRASLEYYDYMSSALPYHVHSLPQNTLILGSATGAQILQAHLFNISQIDAVEPDRQLSLLITDQFADYYGWQHLEDKVTIHTTSSRGFASSEKNYDLVIMGPPGASAGGSVGVHALSTSYDYTVEALQSYLKLLAPDGLLSITLWTSTPARGNLKLFATAVSAMKNSGIIHPENNIAWIRSWNTATLLIKNTPLTAKEIHNVRSFNQSRSFDLAWLPGIEQHEANRFQQLQEPVFYLAAESLLKQPPDQFGGRFIHEYKYDIKPATDNTPYFNHYFRWSSLEEFLSLPGQAGISMIGVGYPTLLATLAQSAVAAFILILLPLVFVRTDKKEDANKRHNIIIYFLAIGLAFLFIEIAFIQKFTLILSQPLYAVAVTLCAFLIFSGLGSLYVQHRMKTESNAIIPVILRRSVILIGLITVCYVVLLPLISSMIMSLPETARITSAFILAAPLAFVMGMPFPIGLATLQRTRPHLIPWAWGINGCASVLSAILAVLLAIDIGFNGVMLCAVVLYFTAWLSQTKILSENE
ncbi:MAG: SAM-dependent methyltransferase [Proteobacteria bacterium]|nr:SAM-dependent methyltransferase [Pseudomonadota bacterium]